MFQKAGEAGWKAFIPLYNDFDIPIDELAGKALGGGRKL
jgi:hypothetical protein